MTANEHPPRMDGPGAGPPPADASLADLFSRLSEDVTLLFRQEVELAKTELKRDAVAAGKAVGYLAGGAVVALFALLLLAMAASWGLAEVLPPGLAFLIVAAVVGAVAAAAVAAGRRRVARLDLVPHSTLETLQQNKQEISDRMTR